MLNFHSNRNNLIKAIWAIAKESDLDDQTLYSIVERISGKTSMRELTQAEIYLVYDELQKKKDGERGKTDNKNKYKKKSQNKRTDENGNQVTTLQRKMVYRLTEELGWNNNDARINGFVKRMFKIDRLEWLNGNQCSILIESLKKMVERENKKRQKEMEKQENKPE